MLTLSGAPNHVVSWSDFSLLHKIIRKLNRICRAIFSRFYRIFHFKCMLVFCVAGPLRLLNYIQQSLAYSDMC